MRILLIATVTVLSLGLRTDPSFAARETSNARETLPRNIPNRVRQIILVTTASWTSTTGRLRCLERRGSQWVPVGHAKTVMVGSNGLAWGRGIHTEIRDGRQKLEGDSCAPAGIFPVGAAFGYSRLPGFPLKIAYRWITDRDYFVDDPESHDYNEWITIDVHEPNTPAAKWKSFEIMKRSDALYELGLIVGQNINPTVKSRGSAIFFHEWAGPGSPTTGCTSMALPDLVELLAWLDPGQSPIIIQAPSPAIGKLTFGTTG